MIAKFKRICGMALTACVFAAIGSGFAYAAAPTDPGRLFYTPAQRAQLEAARARNVTQVAAPKQVARDRVARDPVPPPLRFDGMVTRSDGHTTRWVDGKAEVGRSSVSGLKPGQLRANGKVYEPYQVIRPDPPASSTSTPAPAP